VGNRLSESTQAGTTNYAYDDANRLSSAGGVSYTWDDNGNLLDDGVKEYSYDHANRLVAINNQLSVISYAYNGQGDRLQQTVDSVTMTYTLDLAAGLTQALADGTNTYMYGLARIGQDGPSGWQYHLGDALGSVRQLVDGGGEVSLAKGYELYGELANSAGSTATRYGFTGEWTDGQLVYLRARWYAPQVGRFVSKDTWRGDYSKPQSQNGWNYVEADPINKIDPSGHVSESINQYDLTRWFYKELSGNANSFYTSQIKYLLYNKRSATAPVRAILGWIFLVKDRATWDLKHNIQSKLR
jgi:RHS repeat-associated protein